MTILYHDFMNSLSINFTFRYVIINAFFWLPMIVPKELIWSKYREYFMFEDTSWRHATHYKEAYVRMNTYLWRCDAHNTFILQHKRLNS